MRARLSPVLDPQDRARAQAFCRASAGYSYLQDPDWIDVAPRGGRHDYLHVELLEGEELRGYGLLRRTRLPGGYALGAFRRGPVTANPEALAPALDALLPELARRGFVAVTANPRWEDDDADRAEAVMASAAKDRPVGTIARPGRQNLHSVTGLIDLSLGPDAILAACNSHTRRKLRGLEKRDINVRPLSGAADLELFHRWQGHFAADRGLDLRGQPDLEAQQRWVAARGGDFALIEIDGAPFGAFSILHDGPRVLNVGLAWADPGSKLPRSYITFWHAIRRYGAEAMAGEDGPRWLDVAGLTDPRVARADPGAEGRDRFKLGFPMRVVRLTRVHNFVLRPALFAALGALRPGLK